MKNLIRIAAVLSFLSCGLAGLILIAQALNSDYKDSFVMLVIGLFFLGVAFFLGGILLVAAEKLGRKDEAR